MNTVRNRLLPLPGLSSAWLRDDSTYDVKKTILKRTEFFSQPDLQPKSAQRSNLCLLVIILAAILLIIAVFFKKPLMLKRRIGFSLCDLRCRFARPHFLVEVFAAQGTGARSWPSTWIATSDGTLRSKPPYTVLKTPYYLDVAEPCWWPDILKNEESKLYFTSERHGSDSQVSNFSKRIKTYATSLSQHGDNHNQSEAETGWGCLSVMSNQTLALQELDSVQEPMPLRRRNSDHYCETYFAHSDLPYNALVFKRDHQHNLRRVLELIDITTAILQEEADETLSVQSDETNTSQRLPEAGSQFRPLS